MGEAPEARAGPEGSQGSLDWVPGGAGGGGHASPRSVMARDPIPPAQGPAPGSPSGGAPCLTLASSLAFGASLTAEDVALAGREKVPLQFGLTAHLLQAPVAAVVGMAAPGRVTRACSGGSQESPAPLSRWPRLLPPPGVLPQLLHPQTGPRGPPAHQSVGSTGQWEPPMPQ